MPPYGKEDTFMFERERNIRVYEKLRLETAYRDK